MGLFRYNPKTCRYEPAPFPVGKVLVRLFIFIICCGFFFFLYAHLQASFFPTSAMQELMKENRAYARHIEHMRGELTGLKDQVSQVEHREKELIGKIFGQDKINHRIPALARSVSDDPFEIIHQLKTKVSDILLATQNGEIVHVHSVNHPHSWPLSWPVKTNEPVIASGFGERIHPYHKGKYFHAGIDIPTAKGTEVLAAGKGKVVKVVRSTLESGLGNYVEIEHSNGVISRYACLHDILVRFGQQVEESSVIGFAGTSGNAVAPHVHFEILINGQPVNPIMFLVKGFTAEEYARLAEEGSLLNQSLD